MPADLHFLRPEWLLALPAVFLVVVLLARRRLGAGSWQNVVSPALAPHVLSGSPSRRAEYRWWLLALGAALAVLALAGPAWQRIEQPVFRSDQALVVALDLSRSMDAQDISPSRLLRARLKILDILERRKSGQTALVVYSANAFTVTPLTNDTDTIAALVNSLSTDIMPSQGSYPIAAIMKGRELLENAGAAFGEILLITDGGTSPAAERVARELQEMGYTLSVLAVGTRDGAPIPQLNGGFVTDRSGQIAELRKWFAHDPAKWNQFRERYRLELQQRSEAIDWLRGLAATGPVTILFSAKDAEHSNAAALVDFLSSQG
jgi:Ca-activated chloride channel family protein